MRTGMELLAVRDAEQQLVTILEGLVAQTKG